jgi:hypothetical protein
MAKPVYTDEQRRAAQKAAKARYNATKAAKQKAAAYRARTRYRSREAQRKYESEHSEKRRARFNTTYNASRNIKRRAELEILAGRPKPDACEICAGNKGGILFDHCHQRGHFRGWICTNCNNALGMVNDNITHLRKLAAYLERNRENTSPQLTLSGI